LVPAVLSSAAFLALVATTIGASWWLSRSLLLPLGDSPDHDFVVLSRPLIEFIVASVGALCAVGALRRWLAAPLSVLSPLLLLGFSPLTLAILFTPLRTDAGPWLFLFVDSWPWLLLGVCALQIAALDAAAGHRWSERAYSWLERASTRTGLALWPELTLCAVLAVAALTASPGFRFQSDLNGDEPKYLRFDENWYRGQGLDIDTFPNIDELPAGYQPNLGGNVRRVASGVAQSAQDLLSDTRRRLGLETSPPLEPKWSEGWFIEGKHGGVYQVHNPGFSLLLFPGYFVDRLFLNSTSIFHPQFPTNLYVTNTTVLVLYLFWGVALFRLLQAYTGVRGLSWALALIAMGSLPAAAFNYQYYPEAAAGLVLMVVARYAMFDADVGSATSAAYGLLNGFLPWLHLRFGLASIVFGVVVAATRRRAPRAVAWFWVGLLGQLAAFGLYNYYISGSFMPWALYALVRDSPGFDVGRALHDLPGFWLDARWGLVSYAPIYVLALAGLVPFVRTRGWVALSVACLLMPIAALSAGHGYSGGGTTPVRLLAAVVPLLMLPLADAVRRFRRSKIFIAAFAIAAIVSVQNALTYNTFFRKATATLHDASVSGWKTPLLLPAMDGNSYWSNPVFIAWMILCAVLVAMGASRAKVRHDEDSGGAGAWTAATASVLAGIALLGSAAAAYTGNRSNGDYVLPQEGVRDQLVKTSLGHRSMIAWSVMHGRVDVADLFPNPEGAALLISPERLVGKAREPLELDVATRGAQGQVAWGLATIDFGDGTPKLRTPIVGSEPIRHTYAMPGDFSLIVDLAAPRANRLRAVEAVHVEP
jgi:hypothetical protein